ncbi:hypothetical protein N7454_001485 [Penicillium verhagenii]|nr:hypothetical protein N7454_001485 [Penicillium verhagenii]
MGSTVDQKRPPRTKTRNNSSTNQLDKKRTQNRTSQKCLRERKQAHTRHLESLAELMMVSQNDGDDLHKRNEALVACNLKLIEQNRQLQDALFRMKKKLMGLSNMATAAADDEVFHVLLKKDDSNKPTERSESSDVDVTHGFDITKGEAPATPSRSDGAQTSALACDEFTATDHSASQRLEIPKVCEDLSTTFGSPTFLMPKPLMQPLNFASTLKKPGFKCVPTLMVKQLMKGVFQHMEMVVQWRLTRSLEDRLAIPDPFRPTPLQLNTDYPICIDFLNWPTIRDQLIMQKDDGDFTLLMRDIVMNTVIEFPALNASVNIHDLYYDKISPGTLKVRPQRTRSSRIVLSDETSTKEWCTGCAL